MLGQVVTTWSDPAIRSFYYIVFATLAFVAAGLGAMSLFPATRDKARPMWVPYAAWFIMAPVMMVAVLLGKEVFTLVALALSLVATTEFARATGAHRNWPFMAAIYVADLALFAVGYLGLYSVYVSLPIFFTLIILVVPVLEDRYEGMLQQIALSVLMLLYLGWFPGHLALMERFGRWYVYVAFLVVGTVLNDASAFVIGKLIGKRKVIPTISPNKTVGGLFGALVVDIVFVWASRGALPGFTPLMLVLSVLIFWVGGTMGDLVASVSKRDIGIKDFGKWIPGHGGLLDRMDSLMLTGPLMYHLLHNFLRVHG